MHLIRLALALALPRAGSSMAGRERPATTTASSMAVKARLLKGRKDSFMRRLTLAEETDGAYYKLSQRL